MAGLFYQLGRLAGPAVRKAKWAWAAAAGSEAEMIAAELQRLLNEWATQ